MNFKTLLFFAFIATLSFVHANPEKPLDFPAINLVEIRDAIKSLMSSRYKADWRKIQNTQAFVELKNFLSGYGDLPTELEELRSFIETLDENTNPDKKSVQKRATNLMSLTNAALEMISPDGTFSELSHKIQKASQMIMNS